MEDHGKISEDHCLDRVAVVGMLAWAFAGQTDYQATGAVGDLEVAFADPEWGGEALPEGMWCDRYEGSTAMSPSLLVAGVPTDANAIIVKLNDEMVVFLDEGGGQGGDRVLDPTGGGDPAAVHPTKHARTGPGNFCRTRPTYSVRVDGPGVFAALLRRRRKLLFGRGAGGVQI